MEATSLLRLAQFLDGMAVAGASHFFTLNDGATGDAPEELSLPNDQALRIQMTYAGCERIRYVVFGKGGASNGWTIYVQNIQATTTPQAVKDGLRQGIENLAKNVQVRLATVQLV